MAIRDALLPEFDHETRTTRALLAAVPEGRAAWKPHPKSMSLGDLAVHVATIPFWGTIGMTATEFDTAPPDGPPPPPRRFEGTDALLATFDRNVAEARAAIAATDDEGFRVVWSLKRGGKTVMQMPRTVIARTFVLNHMIHHRGQLTVYLRLLDVPLPQTYGPTADDPGAFGG